MGKKNSIEKEKTETQKPRNSSKVIDNNTDASKKLVESTKSIPPKEKKWKVGFGTTDAKDPKNILSVSTTGLKFQHTKKNLEFTVGVSSATEQQKPGDMPKKHTGLGVSLEYKF